MKYLFSLVSLITLLIVQDSTAQIDTTDVFPLNKGNYWEYTNYNDSHFYEIIVGSEIMPNGQNYNKLMSVNLIENNVSWDTSYTFWRVENDQIYQYWQNIDQKMYDFTLPEGSVWINDYSANLFFGRKITIKERSLYYLTGDTLTYLFMEYVLIDTAGNNPDTSVIFDVYDGFTKGVGITIGANSNRLSGAIINGQKYGYITVGVESKNPFLENYEFKISNYPNPFNPTTTIAYQIPKDRFVNLVVYNSLGQIVATLVNEHQTSGKYSVQFSANNLPSGVYFYKIESGSFSKANKMLLLR